RPPADARAPHRRRRGALPPGRAPDRAAARRDPRRRRGRWAGRPRAAPAPAGRHAARLRAARRRMSRSLYLLRHAKSSWDDADRTDHDRPLAARGRRAADAIARHMREQAIAPALVLSSTARRARETAERIQPALGTATIEYERALYGARAVDLLERVRTVP